MRPAILDTIVQFSLQFNNEIYFSFFYFLTISSNTREESCESALIIHKILQNKPAFMLNDEIYYSKMKSFTLQILQRKNIFHFHGLGLFRLDYTFIFSVCFFENHLSLLTSTYFYIVY